MDTYIITAKSVEEAYAQANAKYADADHEVSCEVIEMPKKGFLGLGSKDAKIKVTVTSSASAELGSIVSDMKKMKKLTDRGNEGEKKTEPAQKGQQQNRGAKPDRNDRKQPAQGQSNGQQNRNNNRQNNNKNNNNQQQKPQQRPQQKPQDKPEQPAQDKAAAKNRSALHNGAKPNVRQQIKHTPGEEVEGASVTVGTPMGLTDFVAEKKDGFGSSERTGGSMSNDIRKKKPAKPMVSANKADEKLRASKYDMAESDDDYKNIETMISEDVDQLEREAGAALGFSDQTFGADETPAEPRKREPVTQAEMDYAIAFANTLLENMKIPAKAVQCECPEGEEFEPTGDANVYPKIEIVGDDTGILIGHHGETLDAIQYLVNLSALRKTKSKDGDYVKIVVDIENYRDKREATLKALARRMAAKAVKYKRNVFLEPMNAYERRIIHSELQSYPDVSTHSVGTDRDRKIIITYEGADKQTEQRSRRRRGNGGRQKPQKTEPQAESGERRRPRKIQKVSIDKIDDILDGDTTFLGVGEMSQSDGE